MVHNAVDCEILIWSSNYVYDDYEKNKADKLKYAGDDYCLKNS